MGDIGQVMGEVKSWLTSSLYLELLQTIVKGTRLVGGGVQCYRSARRGREGRFGVGQNSPCARFFALHASSYMLRTHGQRHDSQK